MGSVIVTMYFQYHNEITVFFKKYGVEILPQVSHFVEKLGQSNHGFHYCYPNEHI
jgi:hypothetical protein